MPEVNCVKDTKNWNFSVLVNIIATLNFLQKTFNEFENGFLRK